MESAAGTTGGKRLWLILTAAALAIVGAFLVRGFLNTRSLLSAKSAAEIAIARDTYGGFRDADRALQDIIGPHSKHVELVALRSYALAQLAARYGDDQAAVDSELLNAPIDRSLQEGRTIKVPPRFFAARALLLLANGEPGSALLTLSGSPQDDRSPELQVVRAQIFEGLEKPKEAAVALAGALTHEPPSLEALLAGATAAAKAHQDARAAELAERALAVYPEHWPSLLLLGSLALHGKAVAPTLAIERLGRALPGMTTEASPAEQCQALFELAQLDLNLGNIAGVVETLDRGADIDETSPTCRVELARIDRRLGRTRQALALLKVAASDDEPGEATLDYAEAVGDPKIAVDYASRPAPPDLATAAALRWEARANAIRIQADLALGQRKQAAQLGPKIEGWELPQVFAALASLRAATGDLRAAAHLLEQGEQAASHGANAGDALTDIGEQALTLQLWALAAQSCGEAARRTPGNYRALVCQARGMLGSKRPAEASAAIDRAVSINPSGEAAEQLRTQLNAPHPAVGTP